MKKTSGGTKKTGRNKERCERYKKEHRREKHKINKWNKLIKKLQPGNSMRIQLEHKIKEYEKKILVE